MIIGIPKEIKDKEKRVALLPEAVKVLVRRGHSLLVQRHAGEGSGYTDDEYRKVGARIISSAKDLYGKSELVVKVKEPLPEEYPYLRSDLVLFCFLHLAANKQLTRALVSSRITALAFETLEDRKKDTPLLKPMSEIAGRLSTQLGMNLLRTDRGGKGVLLTPTEYSERGQVVVIGGGSVGRAAAEVAAGVGAQVLVLDINPDPLKTWANSFPNITLIKSSSPRIAKALRSADLVIGAVYVHGARAPQLITNKMVKNMERGSVLVDVSVDQGGISETTHATTLSNPHYVKYGVIHLAAANLPALVSRTASRVLSSVILPYVLKVAREKTPEKLMKSKELFTAINVSGGKIIHPAVLEAMK